MFGDNCQNSVAIGIMGIPTLGIAGYGTAVGNILTESGGNVLLEDSGLILLE